MTKSAPKNPQTNAAPGEDNPTLSKLLEGYPEEDVELTEEDQKWLNMKPVGEEII